MEERERWLYRIGALLLFAVLLFLLIVILNDSTILVGTILTIFQVVIAIITIAVCFLTIVVCIGIAMFVIEKVMKSISDAKTEINNQLESIRKILNNLANKLGADFLALISGILTFFVQEMIAKYSIVYKLCISIVFFLNFFLASQLIGSSRLFEKIMGIFFYIAPIMTFFSAFLALGGVTKVKTWYGNIQIYEILIISFTALSVICGFVFAFMKSKNINA